MALILLVGGLESILLAIVLFGSVLIHELSHSVVAKQHKIDVRRIILLPIGGMSVIDDFAVTPATELKVSIAGPAMSLLLAVLAYIVELSSPFPLIATIAATAKEANAMLCAFNLLPAIPLDGGRVWRALRERRKDFLTATKEAVALSKFTIAILVLFGIFLAFLFGEWGILFWNGLIAVFIFAGSDMELEAAVFKSASEGITVGDAMRSEMLCASGEENLLEAFELAYTSKARNILIIGKRNFRVVSLSAFENVPRSKWIATKIKSLSKVPPRCEPGENVLSAWKKMRASDVQLAPVIKNRKLVGVVTESDIEQLIYLRKIALFA